MDKTTIAINRKSRDTLGKIKRQLQDENGGQFMDMDDVVGYLIENVPADMDAKVNRR